MELRTSRKITWTVIITFFVLLSALVGMNLLMSAAMGPVQGLEVQRIIIDQGTEEETLYEVEVATGAALSVGLMNRTEPPGPNQGMLFDWGDADEVRSMTMYNTKFPVRVIWLDEDFNSIGETRMSPCPQWRMFFCSEYSSPEPVRYALEVSD